ncbi:amino acid adenylation domain-containing protein [Streptomyces sp. NPDC048282]|uniref:amino acid adenylation domain-containing protein n=1 Tax=Streptomyces sp. NPDC048282 TaxID=3365528 RepID=UPI003722D4FD
MTTSLQTTPRTLVDLLRTRAARQPDRQAYVFLDSHGAEESALAYAELDRRARRVAAALRTRCAPGDRVLILRPPGIPYLTAFFGCLYAGTVAVPSYPPHARNAARLRAIVADAAPAAVLAGDRATATARQHLPELQGIPWLTDEGLTDEGLTDGDPAAGPDAWTDPGADRDGPAFLQYTSGSTAVPKGVMVTHGNLLHNSAQIQRRLRTTEDSRLVSWLPPFHDMGLIGGILQPLFGGFPGVLMAPGTFVLDPVQWLRAVSGYGATLSAVPPFALDLCVERVDPAAHPPLDLACLESVVVGAEPVPATTLDRFAGHFAPWGMRREALRPSFGLAEATLMVSCGDRLTDASAVTLDAAALEAHRVLPGGAGQRRTVVGCGGAVDGQRLLVVDPADGSPLRPGEVGEIWVGGPSVARGYWNRPEESAAVFGAVTAGGEGPFLRTGDLGFLRDGELFVTGRSKDLIIVRGRNLYPQDIERCAEGAHPALRAHGSAALGTDAGDGVERLVVVAEVRRGADVPPVAEVAAAVGRAVTAEFDVRLHRLVLVRASTVPKTSSGKIQRRATRAALGAGALSVVAEWTEGPSGTESALAGPALEEHLTGLVASLAPGGSGRHPGRDESLPGLGLDSLAMLRLAGLIERDLGVSLPEDALYDAPTIAALAAAVGALPGSAPAEAPAPAPDDDPHAPFPQTDTQQAYCLGRTGTFELGNVSTHVYVEFDAPDLDLPRFEQAWRRVIDRHPMLRAVMLPDSNEQRILPEVPPYEIRVTDLRGHEKDAAEAELAAVRERLSHEVRPAGRWPLFEVTATRLDDGLRIHLSVDSLIADFSSGRLLFDDLSRFYCEPGLRLPAPARSFRDHVHAETARRDLPEYRRAYDYWWRRLPELPPAPQLPSRAVPVGVPRFTRRDTVLSAATWRGLKERAARAGLTPSALLLAVYAEVLAVWSNSRHFTLNVPRLTRPVRDPSYDEVLGQFASFTLLEVDHRGAGTFLERARAVQHRLRDDLRHAAVSGVEVLRELMRLQGGYDRALMPVVMTSNLAFAAAERTPLERLLTPVFTISQTPQVTLDCQAHEQDGALLLNWDSVDALFPDGLVDAMFDAQTALLHRLATGEDTWSHPAPVDLPEHSGAGPERPVPALQVQQLFERQAALRPDAPAVIAPERTLSYARLAEESRQVARWLRAHGARPGRLVAIVMEKGWEQVVAAYGVLFSGAAYLPIDPELPARRVRHLLDRGEVGLVLTQSHLEVLLEVPLDGRPRLCVDRPVPEVAEDTPLPAPGSPDDLVYTMFTSGSTGEPKGVMVPHRALVNCLVQTIETYGVDAGDRCLAVTALHHDLSAFDLFGLLGAGGSVVVPAAADRRDPAHWAELVARHRVTLWNSVPAMMEMLLESGARPASLRLVILGGDWIPLPVPGRLRELVPGVSVVSIGGPTETTVWSIWYPVTGLDPEWRSIPYGTPIANVRYHVLDDGLRDCPDWVTGEMYVSGVCLADGYWRDPERTDAVFVAHPGTGERMYRTGDLGRWRPDGTLEFMGRADFQVQIRGQRVEPGEIESALLAHPEVASAVVTATSREDRPGHDGLVAYVVPGERTDPAAFEAGRRAGIEVLDPLARAEFKLARHGLRREPGRPRVPLPRVPAGPSRRRSDRAFLDEPVALAELAACLGLLGQDEVDGLAKCRYPSAGGLYPVQTYLHVKAGAVAGLAPGAYYADPVRDALVLLGEDVTIDAGAHAGHNRAVVDAAGFTLFLVADLAAIEPLYGSLARDLCLLEAGYMGQLLMDWAAGTDVGLCPIGELDFDPLKPLFALGDRHLLAHALVGGRVDRTAAPGSARPAPLTDRLRDWLRERLPAHLVPEHVLTLDSWPLSANGKVDRRRLPAPRQGDPATGYVAPRTATEHQLATLWCEVLDVPRVGVQDNFFDLGGHSLAATRLIARIRDRFQISISLREIFTTRTVADLATAVDRRRGEAPGTA